MGFRAHQHGGEEPRLGGWRHPLHQVVALQPSPQPVRHSASRLLRSQHGCLYRLSLGAGANGGMGEKGLLDSRRLAVDSKQYDETSPGFVIRTTPEEFTFVPTLQILCAISPLWGK